MAHAMLTTALIMILSSFQMGKQAHGGRGGVEGDDLPKSTRLASSRARLVPLYHTYPFYGWENGVAQY